MSSFRLPIPEGQRQSVIAVRRDKSYDSHAAKVVEIVATAPKKCAQGGRVYGHVGSRRDFTDRRCVVKVKTRDWPGAVEMETLRAFRCPANCRRLVHRWRDGQPLPDVPELRPEG